LIDPKESLDIGIGNIEYRERLGGLLKLKHRRAA
jgi:hypothetical protein